MRSEALCIAPSIASPGITESNRLTAATAYSRRRNPRLAPIKFVPRTRAAGTKRIHVSSVGVSRPHLLLLACKVIATTNASEVTTRDVTPRSQTMRKRTYRSWRSSSSPAGGPLCGYRLACSCSASSGKRVPKMKVTVLHSE